MIRFCALLLGVAVAACGGEASPNHEIVPIVPPVEDPCPIPEGVREVVIHALGDFPPSGETAANGRFDEPLSIDKFPAETEEILIELLGPGGVVLAHGRSGRFDLGSLPDGAPVPIFIAPPRSFCPVGAPATPRRDAIAVRARDRVLVVGGVDEGGEPVTTAELYDPKTAGFTTLDPAPYFDLRGARALALANGDVLLVWEGTFQVFDVDDATFGPATVPGDPGVHLHAEAQLALLPDGRALVAGGWDLAGAATTVAAIFDPASGSFTAVEDLVDPRAGGAARTSRTGAWVYGGWQSAAVESSSAELWAAENRFSVGVAEASAGAPLPPGGFLVASETGAVSVVSTNGGETSVSGAVQGRAGLTVTSLDDGALLFLGGSTAEVYRPHAVRFEALEPPAALDGHAAALLPDGSALVMAGDRAWVYRHDLDGPRANPPTQVFTGDDSAPHVRLDSPGSAVLEADPPRLVLESQPHLVLGAAQFADLSARLVAAAQVGLTITLGHGSAEALEIELIPSRGATAGDCSGQVVPPDAFDLEAGPTDVDVEARGGLLTVTIDDEQVLTCAGLPAPRGTFAVTGSDAAGQLVVYAITITR